MLLTADERRTLRAQINEKTREALRARDEPKRPSNNPNGKPSFLIEEDVLRLYRMQQATSLRHVARLVWKHYGYANAAACRNSLTRAFKRRNLPLHPRGSGVERARATAEYEQRIAA